jgi:small subunit ribosomal protein S4
MRYTGPKARLCRREGINLFGNEKYQKILNKRKGLPGDNRSKRMGKMSDFGKQLREKQKLKIMYGITEKQLRNIYKTAASQRGITSDIMMILLESRFDNIVYKAGWAETRMQARQFCTHGHFFLNGRKHNIPSTRLKAGDVIELRTRFQDHAFWKERETENSTVWIDVDMKKYSLVVKEVPSIENIDQVIVTQLVTESYTR